MRTAVNTPAPHHTPAQVAEAFQRARAAQPAWAALPHRERAARLYQVRRLLLERADELARVISTDNGKSLVDAMATEVVPTALGIGFYVRTAKRLLKPRKLRGGNWLFFQKSSRLHPAPYGVVGVISPWNYPFSIPFSEVVMALVTGNACVLKVASDTLAVGEALANLFYDAGFPEGVFTYVNLPGAQAGPAFLAAGADKLFFTGSTEVGRVLMAAAAPTLTPLVLELGGNDAAIVRADADLERTASGILWAGYSNAGQSCGGAQRIFVHQAVYDRFLEVLAAKVRALRVGPGTDFAFDVGAMTSARQKKAVQEQLDECLKGGARVYAQSQAPAEGDFLPATLLVDVKPGMFVLQGEVFGPVVAVVKVAHDEEALSLANASPMGLTGSVWSRDHRAARALAQRVRAGAVLVNDHLMSHGLAEAPWGGHGDSGIGRTHGEAGLNEMLRLQVVVDDHLPGSRKNLWWHPYSESVYHGIRALIEFQYAPRWWKRLAALPRVLRVFLRNWEK